jgi:hypothetical protein
MKNFKSDLKQLLDRLEDKKPFTFSKYADGEYAVLRNIKITNCDNWTFEPELHQYEYNMLLESFKYSGKNYIVGVSCPCCQPQSHIKWMRDTAGATHLTWANLFVNSNYEYFKERAFPIFNNWKEKVVLVANEDGLNKSLPFNVDEYIPIKIGSWLNPDLDILIERLTKEAMETENQLFLFSGGPLGNILCHQLHKIAPNNTYLDIGSTINPWITSKGRGYIHQDKDNRKTCTW